MNILAVDATESVLSVALEFDGRVLSAVRSGQKPHDETLLPAVESLLKRAQLSWKDLDAVAAAAGPGRFTGIRIGLSFAAMAGLQLKIPALALSRLEAAAVKAGRAPVLAALPGWKGEVYHQVFEFKNDLLAPASGAVWTEASAWPRELARAQERRLAVAFGATFADDLLEPARRRLRAKMYPSFEPFYLKPAGYEKPRR